MSKKIKKEFDSRVVKFCKRYKNLDEKIQYIADYAEFKNNADYWEDELELNPYKLMEIKGVGFIRADNIAMNYMGKSFDSPHRIIASVGWALDNLTRGSTIIELSSLIQFLVEKLGIGNTSHILTVLLNCNERSYMFLDSQCKQTNDFISVVYVTRKSWYETEKGYFQLLKKAEKLKQIKFDFDKISNEVEKSTLNAEQKLAVENILKNNVNIFTGYGGTGKSFTLRFILNILKKHGVSYTCLAPTGIASKVFMQQTGEECCTIHRKAYTDGEINTEYLIIDECSMLSVEHWQLILTMLVKTPRFIFIGDINQLTPISPASIFRDTFSLANRHLNVNISRLTEIMRASSETFIPHLCKQFCDENKYNPSCETMEHNHVFFYEKEENISSQLKSIMRKHNFDFKNTYILCPKNVGEFGTGKINEFFDSSENGGNRFAFNGKSKKIRIGSICMNIKNNANKDIYNGERIKCTGVEEDTLYFEMIDDNNRIIEYEKDELSTYVQLSYALSVHKSQGLTVDNIILVCSQSDAFMLSRNLVYTGMSRASKNLVIIKEKSILSNSSRKKIIDDRKTFLGELAKL